MGELEDDSDLIESGMLLAFDVFSRSSDSFFGFDTTQVSLGKGPFGLSLSSVSDSLLLMFNLLLDFLLKFFEAEYGGNIFSSLSKRRRF